MHRHVPALFLYECVEREPHDIPLNDGDIVKIGERLREHRRKTVVKLDGDHLFRALCQLLCQNADAGADLKGGAFPVHTARLSHARTDGGIDEKILSELFGKVKAVPCEQRFDIGDVGQLSHGFTVSFRHAADADGRRAPHRRHSR